MPIKYKYQVGIQKLVFVFCTYEYLKQKYVNY